MDSQVRIYILLKKIEYALSYSPFCNICYSYFYKYVKHMYYAFLMGLRKYIINTYSFMKHLKDLARNSQLMESWQEKAVTMLQETRTRECSKIPTSGPKIKHRARNGRKLAPPG